MAGQLLQNFISLVTFDQALHEKEREIKSLDQSIQAMIMQKNALSQSVEDEKKGILLLRKKVDEQELAMKMLDQKESDKKRQLETVVNSKEYKAIKHEIDHIQHEQQSLEPLIIDAWNQLEIAQKKLAISEGEARKKVSELDDLLRELEQKRSSLQELLDRQMGERKALEKLVPEELLENYQQMRGRVTNPVVPVQYDSCSGCFYAIPAQDLLALKRGSLLPCKSCYRILYVEEAFKEPS